MNGGQEGWVAAQWWRELADPKNPGQRGVGRAVLARLRRAHTPTDALLEPATIDLARRLGILRHENASEVGRSLERVGILAAVLAHVRSDDTVFVARACGPTAPDKDDGRLRYGRFRRLLQAQDSELIDQMRRLVDLMGGTANVADLARGILFWGDRIRRRWALEYFRANLETERPPSEAANA